MKHLKKYNEGFINKNELQDFCEIHLAYLLDDNTWSLYLDRRYITLTDRDSVSGYVIDLSRPKDGVLVGIKWSLVKDHILTFVDMLNRNYDMNGISRVIRLDIVEPISGTNGLTFPKGSILEKEYGLLHFDKVEPFFDLESKIYDDIILYNIKISIRE